MKHFRAQNQTKDEKKYYFNIKYEESLIRVAPTTIQKFENVQYKSYAKQQNYFKVNFLKIHYR